MKNFSLKDILTFGLVIITGIFFQTSFILIESLDTPQKTAIKFCRAFYKLDNSAYNYVTEDGKISEDVDLIDKYRYEKILEAKERGYGPGFAKEYLFNIHTNTIKHSHDKVEIHLTCNKTAIIPWLRTRKVYKLDNLFTLVKENHKWKISSGIESLN